jgi:hypothetical protein
MNAVTVQYFDESKGFWRVGYLEKADLKWAWVRIPVAQTREVEAKKSAD